ncbi:unnamed protein product [Zymoseptoria tritici ST99CH_1A5]|uniref:Uncharacterized protein n=2 Tax=Zymoseptoria tritici TaxID=1047171 RepID=F9XQ07_ZYMTI|nr:uncharacterized protein MYCGRDRAFT_97372 [Zymoseptoria tritici IPO323]EGP82740.1 hypothetical protein MYCGRDRAFT_97372 [Zymoseptoria tritici IPO323]SMY29833.1 unnamed protein product [Zymoseptoria tritici ST99CH_1A5]
MAPTSIEKRGRNSYSSDADEEASLPLYDMSRDESTLPLYAAGSSSAARERPALPDKKATPQEIRDFLTELLVATRGLPVPEAQAIASAWRLGSGQELLGYPPQMYRQLFGNENGWVVCKEARLLITETEWKKGMGKRGTAICFAACLTTLLSLVTTISLTNDDVTLGICILAAAFAGFATLTSFIVLCLPTPTAEAAVDSELKASFFKNSGEQVGGQS